MPKKIARSILTTITLATMLLMGACNKVETPDTNPDPGTTVPTDPTTASGIQTIQGSLRLQDAIGLSTTYPAYMNQGAAIGLVSLSDGNDPLGFIMGGASQAGSKVTTSSVTYVMTGPNGSYQINLPVNPMLTLNSFVIPDNSPDCEVTGISRPGSTTSMVLAVPNIDHRNMETAQLGTFVAQGSTTPTSYNDSYRLIFSKADARYSYTVKCNHQSAQNGTSQETQEVNVVLARGWNLVNVSLTEDTETSSTGTPTKIINSRITTMTSSSTANADIVPTGDKGLEIEF